MDWINEKLLKMFIEIFKYFCVDWFKADDGDDDFVVVDWHWQSW